jgi:hypothetical protein
VRGCEEGDRGRGGCHRGSRRGRMVKRREVMMNEEGGNKKGVRFGEK